MSNIEDLPIDIQKQINVLHKNKYSEPPCLNTSMKYILNDSLYAISVLCATIALDGYINPTLLFIGYSIVMGTVCMGFWVLGHECGHGAFAPTQFQNDTIGFILHSSLLVPYFSWKNSHKKHHKYTNHLTLGETHVPLLKNELTHTKILHDKIGEDAFAIFNIFNHLIFGWPAYLFDNTTGGRTQYDLKTEIDPTQWKDHFHSNSQVMKTGDYKIELSTLGCLTTIYILWKTLGWSSFYWYVGPYIIVNCWLVLYTWLQHTNPNVPHYGSDSFTFIKGALSTIDRPYPTIIDHLHHHIGTTHVAHHLKYNVPHYRAQKFTKDLKHILEKHYTYDPTPIFNAIIKVAKNCHYVDDLNGKQYYKKF